jgi:ubiquinone/menaquinone biosynthesis C-methylase UbiE
MDYNKIYNEIGFKTELLRLKKQALLGYKKEIRMLKLMGLKDHSNILEVGCGPGFYTRILLDKFPNSEVTALDNDMKFLNFANSKLGYEYGDRVTFVKDDVNNLSLPDDFYDFVVVRFVCQHLEKPLDALKEIYRVLKPGGKVIIIDVDSDLWGTTFPKSNAMEMINNNLSKLQGSLNGNRKIGSVLVTMLKRLEFRNLDIEAVVNHSDILGKENFKAKINPNAVRDPNFKKVIDEYNKFFDLEYSSVMIVKLFVCGQK